MPEQIIINNFEKHTGMRFPQSIKRPLFFSWVLLLFMLIITTIYFFIAQPELPIFYSLGTKQDQLANKIFLFLFPLISFITNLIHLALIKIVKDYSLIMLQLFVGVTVGLQVMLLYALLRIVIITL